MLSAGFDHTCAILGSGIAKCWGSGSHGQLGRDSVMNVSDGSGTEMAALGGIDLGGNTPIAVSAGVFHTCALLEGGDARCWGAGSFAFGQAGHLGTDSAYSVGDGGAQSISMANLSSMPLGVAVTAIAVAKYHTCVIVTDGLVKCFGSGSNGVLGIEVNGGNHGDNPGEMAALQPVALPRPAIAISR